jgi:hypothetical protein
MRGSFGPHARMRCTRQSIVEKVAEAQQKAKLKGGVLNQDKREQASSLRKFSSLCTPNEMKIVGKCVRSRAIGELSR